MDKTKDPRQNGDSDSLLDVEDRREHIAAKRQRRSTYDKVRDKIASGLPLTLTLIGGAVAIWLLCLGLALFSPLAGTGTADKLVLVAIMLVCFGMLLGLVVLLFGVAMTWLGVEAAFLFGLESKHETLPASLTFASASPGLLFATLGIGLIGFSLYKQIDYTQGEITREGTPPKHPSPSLDQKAIEDIIKFVAVNLVQKEQHKETQVASDQSVASQPRQSYKWQRVTLRQSLYLGELRYRVSTGDTRLMLVYWLDYKPDYYYYVDPRDMRFWGTFNVADKAFYSVNEPFESFAQLETFDGSTSLVKHDTPPTLPDAVESERLQPPVVAPTGASILPQIGEPVPAGTPDAPPAVAPPTSEQPAAAPGEI